MTKKNDPLNSPESVEGVKESKPAPLGSPLVGASPLESEGKSTEDKTAQPQSGDSRFEPWEFAGWGQAGKIEDLSEESVEIIELGVSQRYVDQLGELQATAICGNDIASSVLYVSALTIGVAGVYAPIGLLLVSIVLFGFRKIYGEVGSALPMNGGAYTVLLNTTNKKIASVAATLTLISYLATAVISATEGMEYLHAIIPTLDPYYATFLLLAFFAGLSILGISESSFVAIGIFLLHLGSLTLLCFLAFVMLSSADIGYLIDRAIVQSRTISPVTGIVLGFCAGMLGISGFESSANFIEEQKKGVFRKTLRNMWITVTIFNPMVCILALLVIGVDSAGAHKGSLLAELANRSGGLWLKQLISIDAAMVLAGAVLTSYVGVIGLVRRMALDRCLPQFLLKENRWQQTNHWIILSFFTLCCLILVISQGSLTALAGVYSLSFLSVMGLFAIGNLLLKKSRTKLPREERASLSVVVFGLVAVGTAFLVNATVPNLRSFSIFLFIIGGAVALMFSRVWVMRFFLYLLKTLLETITAMAGKFQELLYGRIDQINSQSVIYFSRGDNLPVLNRAALYVLENEQTSHLIVIHIYDKQSEPPSKLADQLRIIDQLYPELRVDFLAVRGRFGPQLVEKLSRRLKIPKNCMFIGTPGDSFVHNLDQFGGVRIIL